MTSITPVHRHIIPAMERHSSTAAEVPSTAAAATSGPRPVARPHSTETVSYTHLDVYKRQADYYRDNTPKGEFVLVVRGSEPTEEGEVTLEDGLLLVDRLRGEGLSLRDAVRQAAKELGLPRKQLYDRAVDR